MKLSDVITAPWAIIPEKLQEMRQIYDSHMKGPKIEFDAMLSKVDSIITRKDGYVIENGVAILDIVGTLIKRPGLIDRILFDTNSTYNLRLAFLKAVDDPDADSILLYIDSPGGSVDGTQEFVQMIYEARGIKPIFAFTDGMMASAAYWIGSAADRIYISGDTTEVGSIGVYSMHVDYSEMDKKDGISVTEIVAGKYKRAGSPNKPLDEESREYLQSQIDYLYSVFVGGVAQNRGVSEEEALEMADGKVFIGKQAIEAGLVDGISTMEQLTAYMRENILEIVFDEDGDESREANESIEISLSGDDGEKIYEIEEADMISAETIKDKYPEVYNEILELGKKHVAADLAEAVKSAKEEGAKEGAQAERERIKGIEDAIMPGHEELAREAKFDGKTTPGEFALKQTQAEKSMRDEKAAAFEEDAVDPVNQPEPGDEKEVEEEESEKPFEEQAKAEWNKDKALREEFLDNFDSYLAYARKAAEGKIRILKKGDNE